MTWAKTDAGRQEIQTRALVKERAVRTLLLLIDGHKADAALLACVPGLDAQAFERLHQLGLIAPLGGAGPSRAADARSSLPQPFMAPLFPTPAAPPSVAPPRPDEPPTAPVAAPAASAAPASSPVRSGPTAIDSGFALLSASPEASAAAPDYEQFTAALTRLISDELGLRGFRHTLAVEKASTIGELLDVAERVLDAVSERKGDAVALKARRLLFGRS